MTTTVQSGQAKPELIRWLAVGVLVAAAVTANIHWAGHFALARILGVVLLVAMAGWIAWTTRQGQSFAVMLKEARNEAEKVVWPSREETWQTTLLVLAVVFVISLVLWAADSLFGWIVHALIG